MKASRRLNRRSFIARVAGGTLALVGARAAAGQLHDTDTGATADRSAPGRPRKPTGCSDTDTGRRGDPANRGRRCQPRLRQVDTDSGGRSDAPSHPRMPVVTDRDSGSNADPVGQGRGHAHGCSDTDAGRGADPGGGGRRC